jgi:hypothetical protein
MYKTARVPKLYVSQYYLFGFGFSEKSWTYLLAAQLMFSKGFASFTPAMAGYLAGRMYDSNYFAVQTIRIPRRVEVRVSTVIFFHCCIFFYRYILNFISISETMFKVLVVDRPISIS